MDWKTLGTLFNGKKSHAAGVALILVGLLGLTGALDETTLVSLGAAGVGALGIALRLAITKLPAAERTALETLLSSLLKPPADDPGPLEKTFDNLTLWSTPDRPKPEPATAAARAADPITSRDVAGAGALLLAVTLATTATASEAMIVGPSAVAAPGIPCTLYVQGTDLDPETVIGWDVSPRREGLSQVRPSADGRSAELTTIAGTWRVSVAIHEPGRKIYFRYYEVTVPGTPYVPPQPPGPTPPTPEPSPSPNPPQPSPQPTPGPVPPPGPPKPAPVPEGEFGIAPKVAALVAKINAPNRAATAETLAADAEALAAQVDAAAVGNVTEILTRTGAAIKALNSDAWSASAAEFAAILKTTWEKHAAGRLKLTATGGLTDPKAWSKLLQELAVGLRAVPRGVE